MSSFSPSGAAKVNCAGRRARRWRASHQARTTPTPSEQQPRQSPGPRLFARRRGGAAFVAGVAIRSSSSAIRASAISRSRRFGSFSKAALQQPANGGGVAAGSAVQSGSRSRIAAIVSVIVSPANARRPVSISYSTQPNAQMSVRLSTVCAARLLRAHVGARCRAARPRACRPIDRRRMRERSSPARVAGPSPSPARSRAPSPCRRA